MSRQKHPAWRDVVNRVVDDAALGRLFEHLLLRAQAGDADATRTIIAYRIGKPREVEPETTPLETKVEDLGGMSRALTEMAGKVAAGEATVDELAKLAHGYQATAAVLERTELQAEMREIRAMLEGRP